MATALAFTWKATRRRRSGRARGAALAKPMMDILEGIPAANASAGAAGGLARASIVDTETRQGQASSRPRPDLLFPRAPR